MLLRMRSAAGMAGILKPNVSCVQAMAGAAAGLESAPDQEAGDAARRVRSWEEDLDFRPSLAPSQVQGLQFLLVRSVNCLA